MEDFVKNTKNHHLTWTLFVSIVVSSTAVGVTRDHTHDAAGYLASHLGHLVIYGMSGALAAYNMILFISELHS
jgi:hypothetical protein